MDQTQQKAKAAEFRDMHLAGDIVVLANAWDVPSARIFEQEGFKAVGTTSAGIAISLGYPDGENISLDEALKSIARIVRSVSVPVTADFEAGYGDDPHRIEENTAKLIATGAIGLNIEDSTKTPERHLISLESQVAKIAAIRKVATSLDVPLVINARTDALAIGQGAMAGRLKEAVERGREYKKAGADCVFPLGATDRQTISDFVTQVGCPVNILATNGVPSVAELRRLGVRRVSEGSGPMRATLGLTRRIARELREMGTYSGFLEGAPALGDANKLVSLI